jgi:branched-chain amino acid transport system substrate-binding protein
VQVWVADVNRRGGLGGHPVQLLVYDNGGDRARHRSQVQEAVERKRVLAIVYMAEAFVGHGAAPYLQSHRVPTIGGEGGGEWYDNPMYFPQASSGPAMYSIGVESAAQVLLPEGKDRFGTLVCSEAANCDDAQRQRADEAPRAGFDDVYRGKTSVAQPDYTAECLAARNAGAEVLLVVLDPSSVSRFALSCARQGYRPTLVVVSSIGVDRFKDDPNLDGLLLASNVFSYIQTGTPATDEYQRAMATYGANVTPGVSSALGWVAAKIFERAAAGLPEPPSREAILAGLWSLRDDTLGGLTMPLTFVQDHPATPKSCWWNLRIKSRAWSSPDGFKANCR